MGMRYISLSENGSGNFPFKVDFSAEALDFFRWARAQSVISRESGPGGGTVGCGMKKRRGTNLNHL